MECRLLFAIKWSAIVQIFFCRLPGPPSIQGSKKWVRKKAIIVNRHLNRLLVQERNFLPCPIRRNNFRCEPTAAIVRPLLSRFIGD